VRRVAGDEDPADAEALRHERMTREPGARREHVDRQRLAHRLGEDATRVGLAPAVGVLAGMERGVERVLAGAVDRGHEGAALGIHRDVHPGARRRSTTGTTAREGRRRTSCRP
jgi:hypothetical protein